MAPLWWSWGMKHIKCLERRLAHSKLPRKIFLIQTDASYIIFEHPLIIQDLWGARQMRPRVNGSFFHLCHQQTLPHLGYWTLTLIAAPSESRESELGERTFWAVLVLLGCTSCLLSVAGGGAPEWHRAGPSTWHVWNPNSFLGSRKPYTVWSPLLLWPHISLPLWARATLTFFFFYSLKLTKTIPFGGLLYLLFSSACDVLPLDYPMAPMYFIQVSVQMFYPLKSL